ARKMKINSAGELRQDFKAWAWPALSARVPTRGSTGAGHRLEPGRSNPGALGPRAVARAFEEGSRAWPHIASLSKESAWQGHCRLTFSMAATRRYPAARDGMTASPPPGLQPRQR